MVRVLIGALVVAVIAGAGVYMMSARYEAARASQEKKVADLQQQVNQLNDQNGQLKEEIAKLQHEEERLSAANQELSKAIAQAQLTGKIPPLPEGALSYPPK
jgi:septal ring factor EnvC (AmiA/AmiB activator)